LGSYFGRPLEEDSQGWPKKDLNNIIDVLAHGFIYKYNTYPDGIF
jgi:hypothetical protein